MSDFDLDDSDDSIIHQDSDDDGVERDDDVDIGFRKHQFQTSDNEQRKRQYKEENLYGVFYQEPQQTKRFKTDTAPMFVAASKRDSGVIGDKSKPNSEVAAATTTTIKPKKVLNIGRRMEENTTLNEERSDEAKVLEEQKAADDYFMSLLSRGQPRQSSASTRRTIANEGEASIEARGPGVEAESGMFSSFVSIDETGPATKPKLQSSLGKWEKHTKGIGSKLLAKMGWSGAGGLGSNRRKMKKGPVDDVGKTETGDLHQARKGISRPVEVVVRPSNLGLGFGNFKEASQLKTNRQIEAEVRGVEVSTAVDDKEIDDNLEVAWGPSTRSSAIPGTDQILAQKQWKRKRKVESTKLAIVPYEHLLNKKDQEENEIRIIDMSGKGVGVEKERLSRDAEIQLGAEILHNISFLLNTHETKLHSTSHFLRSIGRKCESFQADIEEMKKRQEEGRRRIEKLQHILYVVSQVEALTRESVVESDSSFLLINDALALVEILGREFSLEEKHSLGFWNTVAPAILGPIIELHLHRWNPLQPINESKGIIDLIFGLVRMDGTDVDHDRIVLRDSILHNQLLPRVKEAFDSTKWIASQHTDLALDLYEYILKNALESAALDQVENRDSGATSVLSTNDDEKTENLLAATVKRVLIFESIYQNLQDSIRLWKPILRRTSDGLEVLDRLDLWILPWLPYLDHPYILPNLITDCRRKMKYAIEVVLQKSKSDMEFLGTIMDILWPWRNVFDATHLQSMVSDYITPRLARHLAKQRLDGDITEDCASIFGVTLEMHQGGLLSDIDFLSVIEGEVLIRWASSIGKSVLSSGKIPQCVQRYMPWKRLLVTNFDRTTADGSSARSLALLQEDEFICRIFWSVLWMLQQLHSSEKGKLHMLSFPSTNFQIVAARRAQEERPTAEDENSFERKSFATKLETRVRQQHHGVGTPKFREVVEEFAKKEGIPFQPRVGSNAMKDGRQIFQFGISSIYIEGDVIFVLKGKEWLPVALDELAACQS